MHEVYRVALVLKFVEIEVYRILNNHFSCTME